jgi:hypothetical protein
MPPEAYAGSHAIFRIQGAAIRPVLIDDHFIGYVSLVVHAPYRVTPATVIMDGRFASSDDVLPPDETDHPTTPAFCKYWHLVTPSVAGDSFARRHNGEAIKRTTRADRYGALFDVPVIQ